MMGFLKKHYEKIVLAVFLLVFISSLVWLITVLRTSIIIKPEDLKLGVIKPDYRQAVMYYYEITTNFANDRPWEKHSDESVVAMDFMAPYQVARCSSCSRIIPYAAYKAGECPICGAKIEIPKGEVGPAGGKERDTDKGGIPDEVEKEMGLDWNNVKDEYDYLDKDAFPNLCEFKFNTDMKNPKSHPPAAIKLFISKVEKKLLPIKLKKIVQKGGDDKKQWEIQVELNGKLRFPKIDEILSLNNDSYKIVDLIPKTVKVTKKELKGAEITEDASEIIIQKDGDTPITVELNKKVYETSEKIYFKDCSSNKSYVSTINGTFTVEIPGADSETYTVASSDAKGKDKIVKLKDKAGKEYKIYDKDPAIMIGAKPKEEEEVQPQETDPGMLPMQAPGMQPPQPKMPGNPGVMPGGPGGMPGMQGMPPGMKPPKNR